MDYYKKREITEKLKKNKKAIIATGSFLLAGVIGLLVGFSLSGWSLIRWLQSDYAVTFFIMVILGVAGLGFLLYLIFVIKKV